MENSLKRSWPLSLIVAASLAQGAIAPLEGSLKDRFESCRKWKDKILSSSQQRKAEKNAGRDCTLAMKDAEKVMEQEVATPELAALILRIVDTTEMLPAEMTEWNHRTRSLCRLAEPYFQSAPDADARAAFQSRCPTRAARIFKKG